jgi:hypothetical protein
MTHHGASYYHSNLPYYSPVRPMNHYQAASTSQVSSSADVPDLYYEQGYRTPSVTSSDMLSTPPRHSHTPWMQEYHNDVRENSVSYMSSWQSSLMDSCRSKRPTVAPIDTNFNYTSRFSPMPFTSAHQVPGGLRSTYSHTFVDNDPIIGYSSALPASLPSSSSSDPSIPSHPPATIINQAPLKLHQPRPSRRIPIISLSNLASACDNFATVQEPKQRSTLEETLPVSPLSLDSNRVSSMLSPPAVDGGNDQHLKYLLYSTNDVYSPTYGVGFDGSGKAILCNCGCMESYTFR